MIMFTELSLRIVSSILAIGIGLASYMYFKLPQDNPIEEISEAVIKKEINLDVDLSPSSKE